MKSLQNFLLEELANATVWVEGLNYDPKNLIVSLHDNDTEGIDLSEVSNPVYWKLGKFDIISIFRRTYKKNFGDYNRDGNPFIYALKGVKGWKFDISDSDVIKYLRRFLEICKKLKSNYDVIITVPSSAPINNIFMKHLGNMLSCKHRIDKLFYKVSNFEASESFDWQSMKSELGDSKKYKQHINEIEEYFETHLEDDIFKAKEFPKDCLKYVRKIVNIDRKTINDYIDIINGKNVLILDDVISSGASISACADIIDKMYSPKSITLVTLLSKQM